MLKQPNDYFTPDIFMKETLQEFIVNDITMVHLFQWDGSQSCWNRKEEEEESVCLPRYTKTVSLQSRSYPHTEKS